MDSAMVFQDALATLPLTALRVLGWVHSGFAITLACGVAGVIASLASDWRHDRAACAPR